MHAIAHLIRNTHAINCLPLNLYTTRLETSSLKSPDMLQWMELSYSKMNSGNQDKMTL